MKIFLSAVTAQFKDCRDALASDLRAIGCEVKVQEDFQQGPRTLIERLEEYVALCDRVIAIVGDAYGAEASGDLVPSVTPPRSYTQWEYFFTLGKRIGGSDVVRKGLFLYYASDGYLRQHPVTQPGEFAERQRAFAQQIKNTGEHWGQFENLDHLCRLVLRDGWQMKERPSKPQNLPYVSLGTLFKGRDAMLTKLRERLVNGAVPNDRAVLGPAQVVHGLGGVGKTRLAVEFGWRNEEAFSALLFVAADSVADLHKNLAELSGPMVLSLGLPDDAKERNKMAAAIRWLQEHPCWFLIVDNVDQEDTAVEVTKLLSELRGGRVLITSRIKHWNLMVEPLDLDVLADADASDYILASTKGRRSACPTDEPDALALARELDGLALALEQASAFIQKNKLTITRYRDLLKTMRPKVLAWCDPVLMSDCRGTVAVTWKASYERLSPEARNLLQLCSWLAPDEIPVSLLGDTFDPRVEALVELDGLHLVKRSDDGVSFQIHRLVQEITRQWQSTQNAGSGKAGGSFQLTALSDAAALLDAAIPNDFREGESFRSLNELQPHAASVIDFTEKHSADLPAHLAWALGRFCHSKASYADAELFARKALVKDNATAGDESPLVARDLRMLSKIMKDTERLDEAEAAAKMSLEIEEKAVPCDPVAVADSLISLGEVYFKQRRLIEREPLYRRALDMRREHFGLAHEEVAECLNNLASALQDQKKVDEAERLYREAIAISDKTGHQNDRESAIWICNLGTLLAETGRREESISAYRRAVEIFATGPVPNHPLRANALELLGGALIAEGKLSEASSLIAQTFTIRYRCFGDGDGANVNGLNQLAKAFEIQGNIDEAERLLQTGVDCKPKDIVLLGNLAFLQMHSRRNFALSVELYRLALEADSKDTVNLANAASLHLLQDEFDQCAQLLQRAWTIAKDKPDCFTGRILFVRTLLAIARCENDEIFVGQFKTLHAMPDIPSTNWPCSALLDWVVQRLTPAQTSFFHSLHDIAQNLPGQFAGEAKDRWEQQGDAPLCTIWQSKTVEDSKNTTIKPQ